MHPFTRIREWRVRPGDARYFAAGPSVIELDVLVMARALAPLRSATPSGPSGLLHPAANTENTRDSEVRTAVGQTLERRDDANAGPSILGDVAQESTRYAALRFGAGRFALGAAPSEPRPRAGASSCPRAPSRSPARKAVGCDAGTRRSVVAPEARTESYTPSSTTRLPLMTATTSSLPPRASTYAASVESLWSSRRSKRESSVW